MILDKVYGLTSQKLIDNHTINNTICIGKVFYFDDKNIPRVYYRVYFNANKLGVYDVEWDLNIYFYNNNVNADQIVLALMKKSCHYNKIVLTSKKSERIIYEIMCHIYKNMLV